MVDLHSVPDFVNKAAFVLVLVINWLGTKKNACIEWLMDVLLGTWEESMKAGVREAFTSVTRFLNGVSTWLYVVFVDRDWSSLRTWGRQQAWSSWWKEGRQSTFNALIATHLSTPRSTPRRRRSASGRPLCFLHYKTSAAALTTVSNTRRRRRCCALLAAADPLGQLGRAAEVVWLWPVRLGAPQGEGARNAA